MRVLAGALLALLATGPNLAGAGSLAVTMAARPLAGSCAVASTATITAYDASAPREVAYRFVRSDGTVSRTGHLAFSGDGAIAQSVRDEWKPQGAAPWVALEIVAPQPVRSQHLAVTSRCPRRVAAATR
ncbi:MAG: hypothetical protein QOJ39_2166 [Candidatus Eremiobacteraeota bacterium]|jgi:hypothetical protein|nr:hypothetical protein [Candidatus Eremiobacteraeota bacterium]